MQLFATKVTHTILGILGVPAIRQGNIIHLPEYALEVVEACSGLRSLATLMALGALYGHLALPGTLRPIILFLATIPIAIATNIVRLLFTAVGAYAISTNLAEDFLHEISGLLVFVTALLLMFLTGAILKWQRKNSS
jgi:exosortase